MESSLSWREAAQLIEEIELQHELSATIGIGGLLHRSDGEALSTSVNVGRRPSSCV